MKNFFSFVGVLKALVHIGKELTTIREILQIAFKSQLEYHEYYKTYNPSLDKNLEYVVDDTIKVDEYGQEISDEEQEQQYLFNQIPVPDYHQEFMKTIAMKSRMKSKKKREKKI